MSELTTIARPYARAVFEFARDRGEYAAWSEQLALLAALVAHDEVRSRITTPGMSGERRAAMLESIGAEHIDQAARNMLRLLAANGRLLLLTEIAAQYEVYRARAEGVVEATVTSFRKLTIKQQHALTQALSKRFGAQVTLRCETDATLLGGAVVRAGDTVIDGSVRGRLGQLSRQLCH